jgi:hypothetical protein
MIARAADFRSLMSDKESEVFEEGILNKRTKVFDEQNLAEFPVGLLAQLPKGELRHTIRHRKFSRELKRYVDRELSIEGKAPYGITRAEDGEVVLALINLPVRDGWVSFYRAEMIEHLGWKKDGRSYKRLEESLLRLRETSFEFKDAWYDNDEEEFKSRRFSFIDNIDGHGTATKREGKRVRFRVRLNAVILGSLEVGYLKELDYHRHLKIKGDAGKRLHRFLDKRSHWKHVMTFQCADIAVNHMGYLPGLKGYEYKKRLVKSCEELEAVGFLKPDPNRFYRGVTGEWEVRFERIREGTTLEVEQLKDEIGEGGLVDLLESLGVNSSYAPKIVRQHPRSRIEEVIAEANFYSRRKEIRGSVAGFIVDRLKNNTPLSKEFIQYQLDAENRSKREEAKQAKKQERDRIEREEENRLQKIDEDLEKYLAALPSDAMKDFEQQALQACRDTGLVNQYKRFKSKQETGSLFSHTRLAILKAYYLDVLRGGEEY